MQFFYFLFFVLVNAFAIAKINAQVTYQPTSINSAIKIDAVLEEQIWNSVPAITTFTEVFPTFGAAPKEKTSVKIAYDNTAIYISAILTQSPKSMRKQLTQRDVIGMQDTENFSISFDTYQDRQNGFRFSVTAAGVQGDGKLTGTDFDAAWDAVWQSAVQTTATGWQLEIKIPYNAIRFAKKPVQNWGMQISRYLRAINSNITWSPEDPNKNGSLNQWGDLVNIKNLVPPIRLSFLPYLSGGVRVSPTSNGTTTEYLKSGGMDVKYGINESFTLDMTLIPDFAQVQSDNVFLNLTPFEVKFNDFRPFFTEGTELFNKAGLFYSRRIGDEPNGTAGVLNLAANNPNYIIKKNPGITRLINATKLSGRTKGNLGIGLFNAVTAPMYAKLTHNDNDTSILTEPLTNYNIAVFDLALKNRSSVTLTNTNVTRKGNTRNANVTAANTSFFDKKNNYVLMVNAIYSNIYGTQYKYNGYSANITTGKVSGLWQYNVNAAVESDTYDPNDLGFLQNNNSIVYGASTSYNINQPTKYFLRHSYGININNTYLYNPRVWSNVELQAFSFFLFKNFWDLSLFTEVKPGRYNDYFEARTPGVNLKRYGYAYLGAEGSTDSRKKWFVNYNGGYGVTTSVQGDGYIEGELGARYRFSNRLQLGTSFKNTTDLGQWGYSTRSSISTLVTGYNDPIIAYRKTSVSNLIVNGQYSFTPRMNATIRLRHNYTKVYNKAFYNLQKEGNFTPIAFIEGRNRTFNVFNIDAFYTWDFKWGSRLTLAWKNALGGNVQLDPYTVTKYGQNLAAMFTSPHSNELSIKVVYFLDYLDINRNAKNPANNLKL